jgi:hypothetical protein
LKAFLSKIAPEFKTLDFANLTVAASPAEKKVAEKSGDGTLFYSFG